VTDRNTGAAPQPPDGGAARTPGLGRWSFISTARSAAPVEVVWPLIGEAARWKEWSWMTRTFLLRPGAPDPDGVGALRSFGLGPVGGSKEEVVAWDPPRHLGYIAVSGLPVRNYRADVDLRSDGGGTVVTWRGSFDPVVPGTGPALRLLLRRLTRGFAVRVTRYAERLS
jgi:hypothetical protein